MLIKIYDELPERIKILLRNCGYDKSDFICGLKTSFKLKYAIPYMWIVVTRDSLVLCNTHSSLGIWALYNHSELNCIRLKKDMVDRFLIEILEENPDKPIINLPLSRATSAEDANKLIMSCRRLINRD